MKLIGVAFPWTAVVWLGLSSTTFGFNSSFQAGDGGGWHLAAPTVGNIDSDPGLEIVLAYRNSNGEWLLDAYKNDGRHVDGFPFNSGYRPMNTSPTLFDLDGDGRDEILFTAGSSVIALRGDGSVFWKHEVTHRNYIPDGGFQAVTNVFYLSNRLEPMSNLPDSAEFFSEVSPPLVVDLEGDGTKEVLTAWKIDPDKNSTLQDYNPFFNDIFGLGEWGATGEVWSGGVIVSDALTGEKKFIYHFHQLVEAGLAVAQLDDDKGIEVLVLNDADAVVAFDKTQPPGLFGKGMLHKKFGKNLRLLSGSYLTGVDVNAADIDGDGLDEVLVPSSQINPLWQPSDSLLDDDGALMWREWKQPAPTLSVFGWFNSATLIPVNPDHDNHIDVLGFSHSTEISFRYWDGVQLVSHAGWPKNFDPYVPTPPVVGDVDGDEQEEIVIATHDPLHDPSSGKLFVFSLDGTEKYSVEIPGGVKHVPSIADVDQDGRTEIVLRALNGRMHILSFGNGGNPSAISWATHRANAQHNGNYARKLYPTGTPLVTTKRGESGGSYFTWQIPVGSNPAEIRIFRAEQPSATFSEIASLSGNAREFTDNGRPRFSQSIYEVRARYGNEWIRSAPFPVFIPLDNNLIVNSGFEEDDNSHWDKWFTGDVPWQNMTTSDVAPHGGKRSMQIRLQNHNDNSTITQSSHYGFPDDSLPVRPGTLYSFGGFMRSTGFNQNTEHWFEWDSSRTAENTNARPRLPWPNYFTPALRAGTAETPWTYLNRTFEMPEGFPNVELRHRFRVSGPASGSVFIDDVFFRALPPVNDAQWKHWIEFGEPWRYQSGTPPQNWSEGAFDDSGWPEGRAKFGAGSGPKNIVTPVPGNQPAYYFRKQFQAFAGAKEFLLAATCTDDYDSKVYPLRLWLNGSEIQAGGIEAVSGEGNLVKYFDLTPFIDLIKDGWNTVAVMLTNTWQSDWDNVAFDISLRAIPPADNRVVSAQISSMGSGSSGEIEMTVRASGRSIWRLESASNLSDSKWEAVQSLELSGTEPVKITDPLRGQSDRSTRFYRLVQQ